MLNVRYPYQDGQTSITAEGTKSPIFPAAQSIITHQGSVGQPDGSALCRGRIEQQYH
jgi:hypothetical protein